jgi:16S rRNA (adenine1518-N6/adenine1519-N6)-dimethyltransferase
MINSKQLIKELGLVPNKALGQNFLIDGSCIERIADLARCENESVLEIGPGLGALTDALSVRADRVLAVEIDAKMVEVLSSVLGEHSNVTVLHRDFLRMKESELFSAVGSVPFIVAANLPYYITTPAAMKLIDSPLPIRRMVLMMQQEASEHFLAEPKSKLYSPLSVLCRRYYTVRREFELSPSCYYPEPAVQSVVLSFEPNGNEYDPAFTKLLKACFAMRRKTLRNNLSSLVGKDFAAGVIEAASLPPSCRAEELSVDDFVQLNHTVSNGLNS